LPKGMVLYATNVKGADNKIHSEKRIVEANIPIMGATNEGRSGAAPEARMVTVFMQNSVPGPRNAINAMCNADTASGRDAPGRAAIELTLRKLHSLVFMVCKAVEAGSMPVPENERFCRYMEATIEYITLHYPDLADKVRMVDVAHSMATVLSIWTAVLLAYAPGFAKVPEGGGEGNAAPSVAVIREKIHSCELDGVQFDILKLRDKVLKHLRIDEDVTFFVIAYMVFNSCQPEGYKILRGVTEMHGHYPFVSFCKKSLQNQEEDDSDAEENEAEEEEEEDDGKPKKARGAATAAVADDDDDNSGAKTKKPQDGDADAQAQPPKPAAASAIKMTFEQLEKELSTYQCRGLNVPAAVMRVGIGSGAGRSGGGGGRRGGGAGNRGGGAGRSGMRSRLMGNTRDARARDDGGEMTIEQMALAEYDEIEGETVLLPPNGRLGRKRKLETLAASILQGTETAPYIYKPERIRPPKMEDYVPFFNPNYILVQGKLDNFAETFVAANPGLKMTAQQVCGELECMRSKYVMAHQLPLVPMDKRDRLIEIEARRVDLWKSKKVCKLERLPVIIPCTRGMYVLIEALLDSPKHIVMRVLRHLCNETTVKRRVVVPIVNKRYPEIFKTFSARPRDKSLKSANTAFMGVETDLLPARARQQTAASEVRKQEIVFEWNTKAEKDVLRRFFKENGVDEVPGEYTDAAIYDTRIRPRQQATTLKRYPEDIIKCVREFDRKARQAVVDDDHE